MDSYKIYHQGNLLMEIGYEPAFPGQKWYFPIHRYGIERLELPEGKLVVDGRFPLEEVHIEKNGESVPLEEKK